MDKLLKLFICFSLSTFIFMQFLSEEHSPKKPQHEIYTIEKQVPKKEKIL